MSTRSCVFCGERPVTREHVWPVWLAEALRPIGRVVHRREDDDDGWETPTIDAKVRRFCADCNNGWMSRLETEVKPVLSPMVIDPIEPADIPEVTLGPDEQVALARWAYKTALVSDFICVSIGRGRDDGPTTPIPRSTYDQFYRRRVPPDTCRIWLASYAGGKHGAMASRSLFSLNLVRRDDEIDQRAVFGSCFVTTITAFRVVFQVFGILRGPIPPPVRPAKSDMDDAVVQIWPASSSPILWPISDLALSDDGLRNFAQRDFELPKF